MPEPDYKNPMLRVMLGREFREATGRWPSAQEIDDIDMDLRADILAFDALTDYLYEYDPDILAMKRRNNK